MIAGLGEKTDFVASVPNVDPSKLNLTHEERAVFDRVGRAAQIFQLVAGSQFPEAKTIALLLSLRAKGAIVPARVQRGQSNGPVSAAAMNEEIELPEEKKREILELEAAVETKNLFELLGVKPGASSKEVREAFYEISRRMHPDRFFKKNLGSFRARIEHVYRKLSAAHETLTDDGKRAAYLKAHPSLLDAEPMRVPLAPAREAPKPHSPEDEAREAERRSRFAKHPYFAKAARLKELMSRAREHMARGEWGHAFTDLHMASQIDGTNDEVKKLLGEVRAKTEVHRAEGEVKRGLELYEQGNEHGALAAFKTASNIDTRNAKAAYMTAKLMWDKSHDSKDVLPFAQRAVDNAPKNPDYQLLVARIMEQAGMKALAKKHFEEVLKLDPHNAEAKKHVKGRWPF